jgi:hypothetical protein
MNRRKFLDRAASTGVVAAAGLAGAAPAKPAIYELRYFRMRNGSQVGRTTEFLGKYFQPAAERAGAGPMGFFGQLISDQGPFILSLTSYPSLAAVESVQQKMFGDETYLKALDEFNKEPGYIRMENSLLRAFEGSPAITIPKPPEKGSHIFELRTYESSNGAAGRRKIKMFDDAEAGIFRRLGMQPVFFGQTIVGRNLPNLTYMLTYDDLAARDKLWAAFGADAEWKKLRAQPDLADALIVSNISNTILRPLPFSAIR